MNDNFVSPDTAISYHTILLEILELPLDSNAHSTRVLIVPWALITLFVAIYYGTGRVVMTDYWYYFTLVFVQKVPALPLSNYLVRACLGWNKNLPLHMSMIVQKAIRFAPYELRSSINLTSLHRAKH